ncbi:MAG: hypothetical protein FWD49_04255 [Firmicutes bacterium]|nr:hypothetical protein [Bacillota bacterium]
MICNLSRKALANEGIFEELKVLPRSYFIPFSCAESASGKDSPEARRYGSDRVILLNGAWKHASFPLKKLPETVDTESFGEEITIPCNLPLNEEGGEVNLFTKAFDLESVNDKVFYLSFLGVSGAIEIYVNSHFAGFGSGGKNTAEFDISEFLREGTNEILVASYNLNNKTAQNGIFRDVLLFACEKPHIYDCEVKTVFNGGNYDLFLNAETKNCAGLTLSVTLTDNCGNVVAKSEKNASQNTRFRYENLEVLPWNAETPNLYNLSLTLSLGAEVKEFVVKKIGFKSVQTEPIFKINGAEANLFTVNVKEDSRVYTACEIESDIARLKELNVNTVRAYGAPLDPIFAEFCDISGLYLLVDSDQEHHRENNPLNTANAKFKHEFADRVLRMHARDKNSPSVIAYSVSGGEKANPLKLFACRKLKALTALPVYFSGMVAYEKNAFNLNPILQYHSEKPIFASGLSERECTAFKNAFCPIKAIISEKTGVAELINCYSFTESGNIIAKGSVYKSGMKTDKFEFSLSIPPLETEPVNLGLTDLEEETLVNFDFYNGEKLLGTAQLRFNESPIEFAVSERGAVVMSQTNNIISLQSFASGLIMESSGASVLDYEVNAVKYLLRKPGNIGQESLFHILESPESYTKRVVSVATKPEGILGVIDTETMFVCKTGGKNIAFNDSFTLSPRGIFGIKSKMTTSAKHGASADLGLKIPAEFNNIIYYSNGPFPNTEGDKAHSQLGVFMDSVAEGAMADSFGWRSEARYVVLRNCRGDGVMVLADNKSFSFSITPDITPCGTPYNLLRINGADGLEFKMIPFSLLKNKDILIIE